MFVLLIFGSARIPEPELAASELALAQASGDAAALRRATMRVHMSHYYDTAREFAALVTERSRRLDTPIVVVTGGPRVGDLYVGVLATVVALWFPPILGGLLIVALIAVLVRVQRSFRAYDARHPTA